jgi:hypothetical protein
MSSLKSRGKLTALSTLKDLLYKISSFYPGKYFGKIENGQKKCPKTVLPKYFPQNTCFVSIIEIYGLATKKVIFNL